MRIRVKLPVNCPRISACVLFQLASIFLGASVAVPIPHAKNIGALGFCPGLRSNRLTAKAVVFLSSAGTLEQSLTYVVSHEDAPAFRIRVVSSDFRRAGRDVLTPAQKDPLVAGCVALVSTSS